MAASTIIFFLSICLASSVQAKIRIEEENAYTVCRNVRIWDLSGKNLTNEIEDLRKCQTIEGYLDIRDVTLDPSTSFPKLVQVTDYVVLYYVEGVTSVADLFPRLSVIRGRNLFFNYSLVLIDNHDLREIGPWSLKAIKRGAVRLESNVLMCINSKAELHSITHKDYHNKLVLHKNYYLCPFEDCIEENWCTSPERTCKDFGCFEDDMCHNECLGGCTCRSNASCCAACKHFLLENTCVQQCPKDHLTYMKYKCITTQQCLTYGWAILKNHSKQEDDLGRCIKKCPEGFVKRNNSGICETRKVNDWCEGATLTNTYLGSNLKGCSVIDGSLIIMVTGGKNVTRQLEENFAKLENITGFLRVVGANALFSLNFLKNLKNIQGNEVALDGCVLCIFGNSNLEELWNWQSRDSKLSVNGKPFIGYNDRLCPAKVQELLKECNLTSYKDIDKDIRSNGKHTDCNVYISPLIAIAGNSSRSVILSFYHEWCGVDTQTFVGYGVYYRESLTNVSKYDGRDICSTEVWKMKFFEIDYNYEKGICINSLSLDNLKPNTRYAIYAESFATDEVGIHTDLAYVTTYPIRPSNPKNGSIDIVENNLLISFEETVNLIDGGFYEIVIDLKTVEPEKDLIYYGSCPEEAFVTEPTPTMKEESENVSSNSDSKCICSTVSPEFFITKRKERVAVEKEIQGLYHKIDKEEHQRKKDFESSHTPSDIVNYSALCRKYESNKRFPSGLCTAPSLDWAEGKDQVVFTELSERRNWTGIEPLTESTLVLETIRSTQTVTLPFHIKTPVKIEVKVRACLRKMTPCVQLNISSSCAVCSDHYKAVTYKVETIPQLKVFKATPKVFDETGKELAAIYTAADCKAEFIELPSVDTKNQLKLDIAWDYSAYAGHLVQGYKIMYTSSSPKEINSTCLSKLSADRLENKIQLEVMQPRYYKLAIFVETVGGFELSNDFCMHIKIYDIYEDLYWVSAVAVFTALLVVFLLVYRNLIQKYPKKKHIVERENLYYGEVPDVLLRDLGIGVENQITSGMIQILKGEILGDGTYGIVYRGFLNDEENNLKGSEDSSGNENFISIFKNLRTSGNKKKQKNIVKAKEVAIKTWKSVKDWEDEDLMKELIKEAINAIICKESEFCVKMLGVYREVKKVYVIYEKMDKTLEEYLKEYKEFGLSEANMAEIAIQIADGLAFMGAKNMTHRDIAPRNILICVQSKIRVRVKISDFGLTRRLEDDYYKVTDNGKSKFLPLPLAPESVAGNKYNLRTDVWSFGVLLWKMIHIGKAFDEHSPDLQEELDLYLCKKEPGHLLTCQDDCPRPTFMVKMIKNCLQKDAKKRPTFKNIVEVLLPRVEPDFREEFLKLSWYKNNKSSDTNSTEGKDEGVADCSVNASLDEDDQPSSSSTSCQQCDDTSFSSLTQEDYSVKNVSWPSLQFPM